MAVEVESTSQVEEFLRVLKKRIWWIIIPFVFVGTLGSSFAVIVPKKYVAMTRVMVRDDETSEERRGVLANQSEEGKVAKHVIRAPKRIRSVLNNLAWPEWQEMAGSRYDQYEYLKDLSDALEVATPAMPQGLRQQVVGIYFAHTDPDKAAKFVQELFERWRDEVLDRGRNRARKVFESVKSQRDEGQKSFESITRQIVDLRSTYGIAPPSQTRQGPAAGSGAPSVWQKIGEDELTEARLEEEIQVMTAALAEARDRHAAMEDEVLDVQDVQGMSFQNQIELSRREILALNQELASEGYKVRHPRYKEIKRKVADLQEQILQFEEAQTSSGTQETYTTNYDKLDLGDSIERDAAELARNEMSLARVTASLTVARERARNLQDITEQIFKLEVERDRVKDALTEIESDYQARFAQQAGIDSLDANPFEILDPVVTPRETTEPNPVLIVLFSVFAGLALGLALAVITEYSKSCFRSVHDVTRVMVVPVLGTINSIVTRSQIRRRLFGRFVMGSAALGFVSVIAFVTWAYAYDNGNYQYFLSSSMIESIESFREVLK